MAPKTDIDATIARLEKTVLSGAVDARANRIDKLVADLTNRRDQLYDKAFPIGGNGVCRDASALASVGAIDKEISALKIARTKTLSGEIEDSQPAAAVSPTPPPAAARPQIVDYVSKNLSNPFDKIERLPEDEAGQKALLNEAFDYGFDHIAGQMSKFRQVTTKNDVETPYSQGTHVALVMTLAWLWTENRQLVKFAREQRLELEARVAALEPTIVSSAVKGEKTVVTRHGADGRIMEFVKRDVALDEILQPLADRLEALESRPPIPWAGTWDAEKQFSAHSFCSDKGGMWYAVADSKGVRPGSGDGVWKLCVKAGKDGRNAR